MLSTELTPPIDSKRIDRFDAAGAAIRDWHSYSNPHQIRIEHVDLELDVLFEGRVIHGTCILKLRRFDNEEHPLILDTRGLEIALVSFSVDASSFFPASFHLGPSDQIRGAPLTIELPREASYIRIVYSTNPHAHGLQWLNPAQTAGKREPFMFTHSEPIYARTWLPLQDTPQVRVTYNATVRTQPGLIALMSAENHSGERREGPFSFKMKQPIPSYLIALAVGDLLYRPLSARTGVYAEAPLIEKAVWEFSDLEKMMCAAEDMFGPYRWEKYDLLVLPPSFPWGGMENPRLTFVTPTVLAGDRSLVSLVAHELAHSWSGNLVTNATWRDFWLNEGFTVYVERRIVEQVYGRERAEMEAVLGYQNLLNDLSRLKKEDQIMHIDLDSRDPDEGITKVPYEKGALFLRQLDELFGRKRFDRFLREYFNRFAFQSLGTDDFVAYLRGNLLSEEPELQGTIPVDEWVYEPGLPIGAPQPECSSFREVEIQAEQWFRSRLPSYEIDSGGWTTQQWLHFLRSLPNPLSLNQMGDLDDVFHLTGSGNSEVAHQWLLLAIRNRYKPAYSRLREYLLSTGRRKLVRPLYEELAKTSEGRIIATEVYQTARPTYHPITVSAIDAIMKNAATQVVIPS
jgi:leukotriene-A4 hydrolase